MKKILIFVLFLFFARPVFATTSNGSFSLRLSDGGIKESSPGQVVTYSLTMKNKDAEHKTIDPYVQAEAFGMKVQNVSDGGKLDKTVGDSRVRYIVWKDTETQSNKERTFTFQVVTPDFSFGKEYCVASTLLYGLPLLESKDCNKIVKDAVAPISPVAPKYEVLSGAAIKTIFKSVFGRNPTKKELTAWQLRAKTKSTTDSLRGAMQYQKTHARTI